MGVLWGFGHSVQHSTLGSSCLKAGTCSASEQLKELLGKELSDSRTGLKGLFSPAPHPSLLRTLQEKPSSSLKPPIQVANIKSLSCCSHYQLRCCSTGLKSHWHTSGCLQRSLQGSYFQRSLCEAARTAFSHLLPAVQHLQPCSPQHLELKGRGFPGARQICSKHPRTCVLVPLPG